MDMRREMLLVDLIANDPSLILIFKSKYTTEPMWECAIKGDPSLFQHMKSPSDNMILFALREDGANIKYFIQMDIDFTPQRMREAIKSYPAAILLIPEEYRSRSIKEFACSLDPTLLKEVRVSKRYIEKELKKDPNLVRFVEKPTEDQLYEAIKQNPNICAYVKTFTPRLKELVEEKYPDLVPMLSWFND